MKKTYVKPCAKMVDFSYDEQVVAVSSNCFNYSLYGVEVQPTCQAELRDEPVEQTMARMTVTVIGCTAYLEEVYY